MASTDWVRGVRLPQGDLGMDCTQCDPGVSFLNLPFSVACITVAAVSAYMGRRGGPQTRSGFPGRCLGTGKVKRLDFESQWTGCRAPLSLSMFLIWLGVAPVSVRPDPMDLAQSGDLELVHQLLPMAVLDGLGAQFGKKGAERAEHPTKRRRGR